ncbi:MAG: hypothetical protein FJZ00_03105 [Candidatus Sericytochromatia bacterium]|uniref:Uncharacterized protein n=1 Tax=Candidatus Tanganyikabacteria bacterium TaxID=2961651 RepID=A0A938BMC1_9BACT|nr:hypothetical protein [Candidatus Tanganyikabacteria bacterium]
MAVMNGTLRSKLGPDSRPMIFGLPNGDRMAYCTVSLNNGETYSNTDRIRFDHEGNGSCQKVLGTRIIKQMLFSNGFGTQGTGTGESKGEWLASSQQLSLRRIGCAAPGVGAGFNAQDEAEINAVQLGTAGTISCEALVFF